MRTVNLQITTTDSAPMPSGTVDTPFTYSINPKVVGGFSATIVDAGISVSFSDVPAGDYIADAVKFGVSVFAEFSVIDVAPPVEIKFQVPAVLNVTLA